ncbi:MAG: hydroxymethylglutaryl-CoA reductase, degradative, partial [Myxococcales bacterium]|nr:hydroxymethylglutaryl-CoA reductase, degradative [Myxococcales bacterium]
ADRLVELANQGHPRLLARGGGARSIDVRVFPESEIGPMLIVHIIIDVCDAMGANLVNSMAERLAGECEKLTGASANLRILSNLADRRLIRAVGRVHVDQLARPGLGYTGRDVAVRMERASVFAEVDPYRATTHNKGIMNGIDAFLLATGQDWRAVEAGAHAFAAKNGRYSAMATWRIEGDELVGRIEVPMQVGIVGGVTKVHPVVKVLLKVVDASTATDIGRIAASVGLAQNMAAVMALATEGIQRGHMSLHARNIAAAVGAKGAEIDRVVAEMIRQSSISHDSAEAALRSTQGHERPKLGKAPPLSINELRTVRDTHWPAIERLIEELLPRPDNAKEGRRALSETFWYQLDTGGKRLRAVIPLVVYEAFGGDPADAVPLAAAIEVLHNATLMHKDAADRLRERRGRDTVWVRFGQHQAVNAGDAMLFVAMGCLGRLRRPPSVVQRLQQRVVNLMLRVIAAQMDSNATDGHDEDALIEMLRSRTGGLFQLAVTGGALLAEANDELLVRLEGVGGDVGVMFQVQYELLGIVGGFSDHRRGAAIVGGGRGLLVEHCLAHLGKTERTEFLDILRRPSSETSDRAVLHAITLLRRAGSLAYGVQLIETYQGKLDDAAATLPQRGLVRLLAGIRDIFLAPLLSQVDSE